MSDSQDPRSLLDAYRDAHAPAAGAEERVWGAVQARVGGAAGDGAQGGDGTATGAAGAGAGVATRGWLIGVVLAVGIAAVAVVRGGEDAHEDGRASEAVGGAGPVAESDAVTEPEPEPESESESVAG
ncbi:MAG: hypothetical protein PVI30_27415, partial [Myxococcales bacterium]